MGHLSIAILKKLASNSTVEDPKFEYLTIKGTSGKYKFFDRKINAIGGSFDYSVFKNHIIQYFEFPTKNDSYSEKFKEVDFIKVDPFKTNNHDPYATSYEYLLSKPQLDHIQEKLKTKKGAWKNLIWLTEKQLLSKQKHWDGNQKFIFARETAFRPPRFSNKIRASLKNLVKAKEKGKLAIFAGAGVSFDSNVPGWSRLVDEMKGDLDEQENEYLAIGQLYYDSRGKKEYIDKIQEVLKHGKTRFNPIHEKIVELSPLHIVSTNYDTHFEQVLNEKSYRYSIVKKDADLPYSKGASLFIKMHGDLDEKNLVLKKDDYGEGYSSIFPLVEGFVKGVFASKLVLFVGFSFSDPNLIQILESVQKILKEDNQPPYLLMVPDQNMNAKQLECYKVKKEQIEARGVTVVEYEDISFNDYFDQIISDEDKTRVDELSLTGQKVYKFLKVVEQFDSFSDSLENLTAENQLVNSILRFRGLGAIPPTVLESVAPFKLKRISHSELTTEAYYDPYTPFHLETLNEDLLTFLQKKLKNGKVDFLSYRDKTLPIADQELNSALRLLYSSGVHCILRKNDTSPTHLKLNPIDRDQKCDCHRCKHSRFEFDQMLQTLNTLSTKLICKNTQQNIGLIEAYGFQKTGQVVRAFYVLEELKTTTWKNQDYITYFLALYNQTLLFPLMSISNDRTFGDEEFEKLRYKIKRIDLNKTIFELPVDAPVRQALTTIKENKSYHYSRTVIEKEHLQILENYQGYNKGGFRSFGPYYWSRVETTFYNLWQFYHENLLFNDGYTYFLDLAHMYIESMIASFHTSAKYGQRLNHFSPFFVIVFVNYGRPKDLKSILIKYDVNCFGFEIQKKSVSNIIESFTSFCKSSFKVSTFFNGIHKNPLYQSATENSAYFESKMRRKFNNFLLLLSKLNLTKKQINIIVENAINYLVTSPIFRAHTSLQYFTTFVTYFIESIDENNTEKLVEYILSDNIWSDDLIEPICSAIVNQQERERFLGEEFYKKIIQRTQNNKNRWVVKLESMIPFFCLLKQEQREKLFKEIQPLLNNNKTIKKAYNWGLWNPMKKEEILNSFLDNLIKKCEGYPDFEIGDDGLPKEIDSFTVWNDLQFVVNIIYANSFFGKIFIQRIYDSVESKMFKWILKPREFDYSGFKITWILSFNSNNIVKELKKIEEVRASIKIGLSRNYNEPVAKIYFEKLMA